MNLFSFKQSLPQYIGGTLHLEKKDNLEDFELGTLTSIEFNEVNIKLSAPPLVEILQLPNDLYSFAELDEDRLRFSYTEGNNAIYYLKVKEGTEQQTTREVFYISCSTGCSCCSDENHSYGFFNTREEADAQVAEWLTGKDNPVASQYAKYGRYYVYPAQAEFLPDGRVVVDDTSIYAQLFTGRFTD
jgi:hypothetical protein